MARSSKPFIIPPNVFMEQGVAMLSIDLNSERATQVNIMKRDLK